MHPRKQPHAQPKTDAKPAPVEEEPRTKEEADDDLDHGLKETFPASDPVSINPGAD